MNAFGNDAVFVVLVRGHPTLLVRIHDAKTEEGSLGCVCPPALLETFDLGTQFSVSCIARELEILHGRAAHNDSCIRWCVLIGNAISIFG